MSHELAFDDQSVQPLLEDVNHWSLTASQMILEDIVQFFKPIVSYVIVTEQSTRHLLHFDWILCVNCESILQGETSPQFISE